MSSLGWDDKNEVLLRYRERLELYFAEQGLPDDRATPVPLPPWPDDGNVVVAYLIDRARDIAEGGSAVGLEAALVWLTIHAWFEGGMAERSRAHDPRRTGE